MQPTRDDVESEVVEVVEAVELVHLSRKAVGEAVPLSGEDLDVLVDERFKLEDALRREDVGDGLALASVLGTVTRVEETAGQRDEAVVVLTASAVSQKNNPIHLSRKYRGRTPSRIQFRGRRRRR